jgi:hypothetical protein
MAIGKRDINIDAQSYIPQKKPPLRAIFVSNHSTLVVIAPI